MTTVHLAQDISWIRSPRAATMGDLHLISCFTTQTIHSTALSHALSGRSNLSPVYPPAAFLSFSLLVLEMCTLAWYLFHPAEWRQLQVTGDRKHLIPLTTIIHYICSNTLVPSHRLLDKRNQICPKNMQQECSGIAVCKPGRGKQHSLWQEGVGKVRDYIAPPWILSFGSETVA